MVDLGVLVGLVTGLISLFHYFSESVDPYPFPLIEGHALVRALPENAPAVGEFNDDRIKFNQSMIETLRGSDRGIVMLNLQILVDGPRGARCGNLRSGDYRKEMWANPEYSLREWPLITDIERSTDRSADATCDVFLAFPYGIDGPRHVSFRNPNLLRSGFHEQRVLGFYKVTVIEAGTHASQDVTIIELRPSDAGAQYRHLYELDSLKWLDEL